MQAFSPSSRDDAGLSTVFGILRRVSSEKPKILEDSRDITFTLVVMAVLMVVTVGFTGLCSFNPGRPENGPVRQVDTQSFLDMESRRVPFKIRVPEVPQGWTANSTRGGMAGGHQATVLGYVTANQDFIQVTQTDAPLDALPGDGVARIAEGEVTVDGVTWTKHEAVDNKERTVWVGDLGDARAMLEGSANEDEYTALAKALQAGKKLPGLDDAPAQPGQPEQPGEPAQPEAPATN